MGLALGFVATLCLSLCMPVSSAWATVSAAPLNFGGNPILSGVAYYASTNISGVSSFNVPGQPFSDPVPNSLYSYGVVDITQTQNLDPALDKALSFSVSSSLSTITPPAGQTAVIVVMVNGQNSSTPRYAPIAGLNGINCDNGGCLGLAGISILDGSATHYYAVAYTQLTTLNIQLFPKDICADYAKEASGVAAFGCDANGNIQAANPSPSASPSPSPSPSPTPSGAVAGTPLQLTFEIVFIDSNGNVQGSVQDQGPLSLLFQSSSPSFPCPTDLANRYFPGDGSISLDATEFYVAPTTGIAPQTNLVTVGKIQSSPTTPATPVLDATFPTSDNFNFYGGFSNQETVTGFLNTDAQGDNTYTLGFMVRDASGIINPVSSNGGACTQAGIETSTVNTFLNQSKCFIATAAFNSIDAAPVAMLREFRDRVLLRSRLGSGFVHWYYQWSPPAAEWLMRHPRARLPVLQALVPVEAAAWLMLHPLQLALLLAFTVSGLALGGALVVLIKTKRRAQG